MDSIKGLDNNTETVPLAGSHSRKVTKMKALERLLTQPLAQMMPEVIEQPVRAAAAPSVATIVHRSAYQQSCGIDADFKHYLDKIARGKPVHDTQETDKDKISREVNDVITDEVHIKEEPHDSNESVQIVSKPDSISHAKQTEPSFSSSNAAPGGLFSNLLVKLADTVRSEHIQSGSLGAGMSASCQKPQNDRLNSESDVNCVKETSALDDHNLNSQFFDNDTSYNSDIEGSNYCTTSGSQSSGDGACLDDFNNIDAQSGLTAPNTVCNTNNESILKQAPSNVQYLSNDGIRPSSSASLDESDDVNKVFYLPAASSESTGSLMLECTSEHTIQTVYNSSLNASDAIEVTTIKVEAEDLTSEAMTDSVNEEKDQVSEAMTDSVIGENGSSLNWNKVDELTNDSVIEEKNSLKSLNRKEKSSSLNGRNVDEITDIKVEMDEQASERMYRSDIEEKASAFNDSSVNNGEVVKVKTKVPQVYEEKNASDMEVEISSFNKCSANEKTNVKVKTESQVSEVVNTTVIEGKVSNNDKNVDGPPYKCEICGKDFKWKHNWRYHLDTHTGKTPFECEICHKLFSHRGNLDTHRLVHTGETPYHCKVCDRGFTQRGHLKTHEYIHTGEFPFKCKECDKGFRDTTSLKRHMYNHVKETPFKCELCDKYFKRSRLLKAHMLSHAGMTLFPCQFCEKGFTEASSLQTHMYKHTGEKPFKCELCDERFAHSGALKIHVYKHKGEQPYKCDVCSKGFWQSSNWKSHMMIHTGERPYTCEVCKKGFIQVYSLQQHQRTHTGDKPYACSQCSKEFAYASTYKKHMQRVHKQ